MTNYLIAGVPMIPYLVFALLVLGVIAVLVSVFILPHLFAEVSDMIQSIFRKRTEKPPPPKQDSN